MARRDKQSGRRDVEEEARELLADRAAASVEAMLGAIHRVNPTGRSLSPEENLRRYGLKARLQSRLVRDYADRLAIERDPEREGVVTLRHRASGLDACHAVLAELDEEARARLQYLLDVGPDEEPQPVRPHRSVHPAGDVGEAGAPDGDALRAGRDALAAYDFELAERCFREALRRDGSLEAALALLELLVDHVAADGAAVELGPELSQEGTGNGEVCALLALAAARSDNGDVARSYLGRAEGPRAVEAVLALARGAAGVADWAAAEELLAAARDRAPADAAVVQFADELMATRARAHQREEAELERLRAAGDLAEAERQAHALLERWSESKVARRVLRESAERRRDERVASLLAQAELALAAADLGLARQIADRLQELGGDGADLAARVAAAVAGERQASTRRQADRVIAMLAVGLSRTAATEYLTLGADARALVRQGAASLPLTWLDHALTVTKRTDAAVDAVLALVEAGALLGEGDADGALAALEPHQEILRGIPRAREVLGAARQQVALRRQRAAEAELAACREALAGGDEDGALQRLAALDTRALSADGRAAAEALQATIRRSQDLRRRATRVADLESSGDLIQARREVDGLLALVPEGEQAAWLERRALLSRRLREAWHVHVEQVEAPAKAEDLADLPRDLGHSRDEAHILLSAQGREAVLPVVHGAWVFLRIVEVASGRIIRVARLKAPAPLGYAATKLDGDTLWIIGDDHVLVIGLPEVDIREWRSLNPLFGDKFGVEDFVVGPGGTELWVQVSRGREPGSTRVIDTRKWTVCQDVKDPFAIAPLFASDPPLVAASDLEHRARLFTLRGRPAGTLWPESQEQLFEVADHPGGEGAVALAQTELRAAEEEGSEVDLVELQGGRVHSRHRLEGSHDEMSHCVATARAQQASFVLFDREEGQAELHAFQADAGQLAEIWRVGVPRATVLMRDSRSQRVAVLVPTGGGAEIQPLGCSQPVLPAGRHRGDIGLLPYVGPSFVCPGSTGVSWDDTSAVVRELDRLSGPARADWLARLRDAPDQTPAKLAALCRYLHGNEQAAMLDHALQRFPGHSVLLMRMAEQAAGQGAWEKVRELLAPLDMAGLPDPARKHTCHLLGSALVHLGDAEGACEAWQRGRALAGSCDLDTCLLLVSPLPEPLSPVDWGPDRPLVTQVRGAVTVADACLAAGDPAGAKRALERPALLAVGEMQSRARLAAAYLADEPADPLGRFRMALALARLCVGTSGEAWSFDGLPLGLPLPGCSWPESRLRDLAARARAWLDRSERSAAGGNAGPEIAA